MNFIKILSGLNFTLILVELFCQFDRNSLIPAVLARVTLGKPDAFFPHPLHIYYSSHSVQVSQSSRSFSSKAISLHKSDVLPFLLFICFITLK